MCTLDAVMEDIITLSQSGHSVGEEGGGWGGGR